jgi:hypothetical protein
VPSASTTISRRHGSARRNEIVRWAGWLLLSLLVHSLLLDPLAQWFFRADAPLPEPAPRLAVRLASPPPTAAPARQIVDAPAAPDQRPPEQTDLLGRVDQRVEQESIAPDLGEAVNRAGQAAPADAANTTPAPQNPPAEAADREASRGQDLARFMPDPAAAFPSAPPAEGRSTQRNAVDRPTGPVTLLNTRSSPYADYLIERGHRAVRLLELNVELTSWYSGDLQNLRLPAVVLVDIDAAGRVLAAAVEEPSGSDKVDRMLVNALRGAVTGKAPPAEALERGQVRIVMALERNVLKIGIR